MRRNRAAVLRVTQILALASAKVQLFFQISKDTLFDIKNTPRFSTKCIPNYHKILRVADPTSAGVLALMFYRALRQLVLVYILIVDLIQEYARAGHSADC